MLCSARYAGVAGWQVEPFEVDCVDFHCEISFCLPAFNTIHSDGSDADIVKLMIGQFLPDAFYVLICTRHPACLGSEIESVCGGVVGCWSGLFSGVDPEALDGCWVGEQLGFAKEGLSVRSM